MVRSPSSIAHLNECSQKDLESSQGGGNVMLQSTQQQPGDMKGGPSTEKQSLEITMQNTMNRMTGSPRAKAMIQAGYLSLCQEQLEDGASQNNRSTQRRNIMSRQSSPMSKTKMTPTQGQSGGLIKQIENTAGSKGIVGHSGSDKTVGAFRPRNSENLLVSADENHPRGAAHGKQATLTARDDPSKSLSSNQINALEADSDKDYIFHNHVARVPMQQNASSTIPRELKVHKINSDSTI